MSRQLFYVLKDREPVPATRGEWEAFFQGGERVVIQDDIGEQWVNTVFIGLDATVEGDGLPLLFETMVFDAEGTARQIAGATNKYATWDEATTGHAAICDLVRVECGL